MSLSACVCVCVLVYLCVRPRVCGLLCVSVCCVVQHWFAKPPGIPPHLDFTLLPEVQYYMQQYGAMAAAGGYGEDGYGYDEQGYANASGEGDEAVYADGEVQAEGALAGAGAGAASGQGSDAVVGEVKHSAGSASGSSDALSASDSGSGSGSASTGLSLSGPLPFPEHDISQLSRKSKTHVEVSLRDSRRRNALVAPDSPNLASHKVPSLFCVCVGLWGVCLSLVGMSMSVSL